MTGMRIRNTRMALSDRMFWAAFVDLKNDKIVPTTHGGTCQRFFDILFTMQSYSEFLNVYTNQFVVDRYREEFLKTLDPKNIETNIKNGALCSINYAMITTEGNQRRMMITVFSADGDSDSGKFTLTASSIDTEYNILTQLEEYEERSGLEESKARAQMKMLENMDEVYHSVISINLVEQTYQEIFSGRGVHSLIQDITNVQEALDLGLNVFVSNDDKPKMKQFFDLETLLIRLGEEKIISAELYTTTDNWVRASFRPVTRDIYGIVTEVFLTIQMINDEKRQAVELQEKLNSVEYYDSLTGLLNRKGFIFTAEKILSSETKEERKKYVFLYTNIYNFKLYNIEFGAEDGDVVLKYISEHLTSSSDIVLAARFGQDHLAIMTKQSDDEVKADASRICQTFYDKYNHFGLSYKIGSYRIHTGDESVYAACELAKLACDSIRTLPEGYRQYDEVLGRKVERDTYVLQHFEDAIHHEYLQVYFQPVVRTLSGKVCGLEALARWVDPKYGFLAPIDFIPVLEENRMISKLDLYVLRRVCKVIQNHLNQNLPIVPISFNLSRVDFEEGDIFNEVERIVTEENVPRNMINIEITESVLIHDDGNVRSAVERFRDAGYQVWMDDFGSGFSSLNVLKDYEFDEIKLDMRFIDAFDEKSKSIVKSIVEMAKRIGVQTLAEGVETKEQYDFLRNVGCEKVQGYFISKPIDYENAVFSFLNEDDVENIGYRKYYDIVGKVNVLTDKPLALIEWDGENFDYLFANDEYEKEMISTGVKNLESALQNMNQKGSALNKIFLSFIEDYSIDDGEKELIYSIRGSVIHVVTACIAQYENHKIFKTRVMNLSEVQDQSLRMMNRLDDSRTISTNYEMLWNSFTKSNLINMFCKDTEHRFMGVNDKFLQTYGFEKITDVLGKTDAEMGWHPDDKPFHDDEYRVLKYGESMINRIGECIIQGEVHKILASKEPIYHDDKIVGLIGIFIDLNELEKLMQKSYSKI